MRSIKYIIPLFLLILSLPAFASLFSTSEEIKIGQQGSQQLEAKYGTVNDPELNARLNKIGQAIAAQGSRGLTYHFKVLNTQELNALAFPGGFVYATHGIMKAMPDNQLAFVLGHEVGHVECRHSVKSLEKQTYTQLGGNILLTLLNKGKKTNSNTLTAIKAANLVISNRYSQGAENEADAMGMQLMAKAGYDPYGAVEALETLQKLGGKSMSGFMNSFLGDHPLTKDRIKRAQELAPQIPFNREAKAPST